MADNTDHGNNKHSRDADAISPRGQGFPKKLHIIDNGDFQRLLACKQSVAGKRLVIYYMANGLDYCRLGVAVGRKYGKAVTRNRIKRWLREAFRLNKHAFILPMDLLVICRNKAVFTGLKDLEDSFLKLATRLRDLPSGNGNSP
ncbi:ribonuclease P protein component [Planctomycetota bacterium]